MPRAELLLASLLFASCSSVGPDPDSLRVLFVGNSLTYTNDLPAMVEALAESQGHSYQYSVVAFPNFSLEDHWYQGDARAALTSERWDYVVMQQGPSSLPENQTHLRTWVQRFAEVARENGTEPAIYMVWPSEARSAYFGDVFDSYTAAAEAVDGLLLPVGHAWLEAWERNPLIQLYDSDRFHPSQQGSYLAALVIYGGLFRSSPTGLPNSLELSSGSVTIPLATSRTLQGAAAEALGM